MNNDFVKASQLGIEKHPRKKEKILQYGTAGFREKSTELEHVMYRMGLLATLLSKSFEGQTVGLMITASHNPEEDNGVKLCDPKGAMLNPEWETSATDLVNANDENLEIILNEIFVAKKINYNFQACVHIGRDTRSSSVFLSNAALDGIHVLNGKSNDFGLLTTPQLHFLVYCKNFPFYGSSTIDCYYRKYSEAFEKLRPQIKIKKRYDPVLHVDGANGVGALKALELKSFLKTLDLHIFNDGSKGKLNFKCGSDFVKVEQRAPEGCNIMTNLRYATFDGDADRLIYFYFDEDNNFHLLDGDKIAGLVAKFLKELVEKTELDFSMRVIQTAYANGSSTVYFENVLKIPTICVCTGVKNLHHEALKYDIGIYFEANGHGTVLFSEELKEKCKKLASDTSASKDCQNAAEKLLNIIDLINETVGDAITDMLLVETILYDYDWKIEDWDAIYKELHFCLLKAQVPDRQSILTTNASRNCIQPSGLQEAIDLEVSKYKSSRSFVRPSGTEDVVRIYAEAESKDDALALAKFVCKLVEKFTQ